MSVRLLLFVAAAVVLVACASLMRTNFDKLYGPPVYKPREVAALEAGQVNYWQQVQPVLDKRCVVCHGCYDAPCQLKLSSIEGIERGASDSLVYHQSRLKPAEPTRLYQDAQLISAWRQKGFFPVLSEYPNHPESWQDASVMYRMLELKEQNPLPDKARLSKEFTFGLARKQTCTDAGGFDKYARDNPLWGMPYAMQGLDESEQQVLKEWISQGAVYPPRAKLGAEFSRQVAAWETFLNGDDLKQRLVSRYLYEHLFLAHLYFSDIRGQEREHTGGNIPHYFRLVRSRTPPGQPVDRIVTRRPYEVPGTERVYYRLVRDLESVVVKTHHPYALSAKRMQRWQQLFLVPQYTVDALPGYEQDVAANPFASFAALPINSRYRFLLDDAHYVIQGFIKGPVCRGQVALNVIRDHFWVFFMNPEDEQNQIYADFLAKQAPHLAMPNIEGDTLVPISHWRAYAKKQREYLTALDKLLAAEVDPKRDISLDRIWNGDGVNDNAGLTIFRHFDTASIFKGLLGGQPRTAFIIDYALLERIHYLLVAGYDVYGNVGHQLLSRAYMDFLRMEGETAFLQFLPKQARDRERAFWYRGANKELKAHLELPQFEKKTVPAIPYRTSNPKAELFSMLEQRLEPVLPTFRSISTLDDVLLKKQLQRLAQFHGEQTALLPELMVISIDSGSLYFSLINNHARSSMTSMFKEQKTLVPKENTVSVLRGIAGAHPVALVNVLRDDLPQFVDRVFKLRTEDDYRRLMDTYGIRRNNPNFWSHIDALHQGLANQPLPDNGILDLNRLEDR